jgi:hypothetical protein
MDGETINQTPLVRGLGSEDADKVKEVNFSNSYYKMVNKYGREVCISTELEADKLKRGFIHTDRKVYSDDLSQRVRAPLPVTPMEAVAKMAEQMAESSEITTQVLEEVTGIKRGRKKKE